MELNKDKFFYRNEHISCKPNLVLDTEIHISFSLEVNNIDRPYKNISCNGKPPCWCKTSRRCRYDVKKTVAIRVQFQIQE